MIRALAGAWYELKEEHNFTDDQIGEYFSSIQSVMDSPLPKDSPWLLDGLESDFYQGAKGYTSPNAHRGVDKDLTAALVKWALSSPSWLGHADADPSDPVVLEETGFTF